MALGLISLKEVQLEKGRFHYLIAIEIGLVEKNVVDLAVVVGAVAVVDAVVVDDAVVVVVDDVVVAVVVVGMLVIAAAVAVKCVSFGPKMQDMDRLDYSSIQHNQ